MTKTEQGRERRVRRRLAKQGYRVKKTPARSVLRRIDRQALLSCTWSATVTSWAIGSVRRLRIWNGSPTITKNESGNQRSNFDEHF